MKKTNTEHMTCRTVRSSDRGDRTTDLFSLTFNHNWAIIKVHSTLLKVIIIITTLLKIMLKLHPLGLLFFSSTFCRFLRHFLNCCGLFFPLMSSSKDTEMEWTTFSSFFSDWWRETSSRRRRTTTVKTLIKPQQLRLKNHQSDPVSAATVLAHLSHKSLLSQRHTPGHKGQMDTVG